MCQGKILHTRNHKNEIPLEENTVSSLENATDNPQ